MPIDRNRRNFLKVIVFGAGALVLGKVLGPLLAWLNDGRSETNKFDSFRTVENQKRLTVYDKGGEEIFIIDKDK